LPIFKLTLPGNAHTRSLSYTQRHLSNWQLRIQKEDFTYCESAKSDLNVCNNFLSSYIARWVCWLY